MARKHTIPSYRLHRQSGQAVVTLSCAVTGKRRDHLLGEHGSDESRQAYAATISAWEAAGRVLDQDAAPLPTPRQAVTVGEVLIAWWESRLARYGVEDPTGRLPSALRHERNAVKIARATCGATPAARFGPVRLAEIRQAYIDTGWTRGSINKGVGAVVRAFKKAVADEIVRPDVVTALECLPALKRGEGGHEGEKVHGVAIEHVEAVRPFLSPQVAAIVDVMLLTGARCGEVCITRPCDIELGDVWTYRPATHKGEHRGHERLIPIGPKAQAVIEPYLDRRVDAYCFSPREAEAWRRAQQARQCDPNASKARDEARHEAGRVAGHDKADGYTTDVVRRAIARACDKADVPRWSPHQLRHAAATLIRRAAGVEAAAIVLGHSSAVMTDSVYAERDSTKAKEIIKKIG